MYVNSAIGWVQLEFNLTRIAPHRTPKLDLDFFGITWAKILEFNFKILYLVNIKFSSTMLMILLKLQNITIQIKLQITLPTIITVTELRLQKTNYFTNHHYRTKPKVTIKLNYHFKLNCNRPR